MNESLLSTTFEYSNQTPPIRNTTNIPAKPFHHTRTHSHTHTHTRTQNRLFHRHTRSHDLYTIIGASVLPCYPNLSECAYLLCVCCINPSVRICCIIYIFSCACAHNAIRIAIVCGMKIVVLYHGTRIVNIIQKAKYRRKFWKNNIKWVCALAKSKWTLFQFAV